MPRKKNSNATFWVIFKKIFAKLLSRRKMTIFGAINSNSKKVSAYRWCGCLPSSFIFFLDSLIITSPNGYDPKNGTIKQPQRSNCGQCLTFRYLIENGTDWVGPSLWIFCVSVPSIFYGWNNRRERWILYFVVSAVVIMWMGCS